MSNNAKRCGEFEFRVLATDEGSSARVGSLRTPHGTVETPVFMPVGTQGTVKTLTPAQLCQAGVEIVLANTYHLHLRPGEGVVKKLGGLHGFMNWPGPILTDSGGFQVFSLAELRKVTDDGVLFASHIDGRRIELTPESVIDIQSDLRADIIMPLDECVPFPVDESVAEQAIRRTVRWAERSRRHMTDESPQTLFGIVQGSTYGALRRECARQLVDMDFAGYAIGGLSVGEGTHACMEMLEVTVPELPTERPHYLMGVGPPADLLLAVERGIDMFDCVLPTRNGRSGFAFTSTGVVRLRNAAHIESDEPLDENCECYTCRNFSRGYLRHLMAASEILGMSLVSLHNVAFFCDLMRNVRKAIREGRFGSFKREILAVWT